MPFTVAEIARHVGGEVVGDATLVVQRFAPADRAQPGDLTFAENERFFARAEQSGIRQLEDFSLRLRRYA